MKLDMKEFIDTVLTNGSSEMLVRRIKNNEFMVDIGGVIWETGDIESNSTENILGYFLSEAIDESNSRALEISMTVTSDCEDICAVEFKNAAILH